MELSKRPADAAIPQFPKVCPDCGTPLVKAEDEAKYFCPNADGCPTQIKGKLIHFMGRKAMNILAGDATADQLYNRGLVRTPADLYDLRKRDLVTLEGWKDRSADRFLESLRNSIETPFDRVLFALGIRFVGETTAKELARHFGDIDSLASAGMDDLLGVPDVGDVIARSVLEWFAAPAHKVEIQRLKAAGLHFSMTAQTAASSALDGKTIVISGNFSISRDEMKALIEANGGKNSSSVSSKTSYLLAGTKPGPEKLRKAAELGIPVIGESDLRAMLPSGKATAADEEDFEPNLFGI